MLWGSSQPSWVHWPFSVSTGTVSGSCGGLCLRWSCGSVRLVDGWGSLAMELGPRFGLLEQLGVLAPLEACTECVDPFQLFKASLADMPDCLCCGGSFQEHAFYYCRTKGGNIEVILTSSSIEWRLPIGSFRTFFVLFPELACCELLSSSSNT